MSLHLQQEPTGLAPESLELCLANESNWDLRLKPDHVTRFGDSKPDSQQPLRWLKAGGPAFTVYFCIANRQS